MPNPDNLNSCSNETREQSALPQEIIISESAGDSGGCNLELRETEDHESASNDYSVLDHQYAVLVPKCVQKGPYVCHVCGKTFKVPGFLKRHLWRLHDDRRRNCPPVAVLFSKRLQKCPYVCHLCGKIFKMRRYLLKHLRKLHDESSRRHPPVTDDYSNSALSQMSTELLQSDSAVDDTTVQKVNANEPSADVLAVCKLCGWVSDKSVSLEAHMQIHRREKQVARHHSGAATVDSGDNQSICLRHHSKARVIAARATCDICGWVCKNSSKKTSFTFVQHMRSHTGEKPFKCGQCALTFSLRENLNRHKKLHSGRGRFLCQHCAQSFHQKDGLLCHMHRYHVDKLDPDPSTWPYSCRFCGERFYTDHLVRRHVHRQHKSVCCEVCGKMFHGYLELQNHKCANSGAFGCNICQMSYASAAGLKQHLLIHQTDSVRATCRCKWCNEQFELMTALECHVVDIHSAVLPQYHCSKCKKPFVTAFELKGHMRSHTEAPFVCTVCGKGYKLTTKLSLHMSTCTGTIDNRRKQCNVCGKTFNAELNLRQHMRVHAEKTLMCTVCGKKYTFLQALDRHMLSHDTCGQYQCGECEKSFSMERTLQLHMRLHSNKAFACTMCHKKFIFSSKLKSHMATHIPPAQRDSAQMFVCDVCGKLLSSQWQLKFHKRVHSGVKPHMCSVCGRAFRQPQHLTRHVNTHTKFKPYFCSLCGKAYSQRVDLCHHSTRVHNVHIPVHHRFKTGIGNCQE